MWHLREDILPILPGILAVHGNAVHPKYLPPHILSLDLFLLVVVVALLALETFPLDHDRVSTWIHETHCGFSGLQVSLADMSPHLIVPEFCKAQYNDQLT